MQLFYLFLVIIGFDSFDSISLPFGVGGNIQSWWNKWRTLEIVVVVLLQQHFITIYQYFTVISECTKVIITGYMIRYNTWFYSAGFKIRPESFSICFWIYSLRNNLETVFMTLQHFVNFNNIYWHWAVKIKHCADMQETFCIQWNSLLYRKLTSSIRHVLKANFYTLNVILMLKFLNRNFYL